jgi:hypothetical protein
VTTATPGPLDDRPPAICKTPQGADGAWFTEVTAQVGLAKSATLEPVGTSVVAGDLDGDGYADLVAHFFPSQREPAGTKRTRFVFMNRPDPKDAANRIFVDASEESGLFATRDGVGGRGFSNTVLGDLDGDGDLDAILCPGGADPSQLVDPCDAFLNDGKGHFALGPQNGLGADIFWVTSTALLDFDRDGALDFYPGTSGRWVNGPTKQSAPRLYRGAADGTFANVAGSVGLPTKFVDGQNNRSNMGNTVCDLDGNGDVDLLTANYGRNPNEVFLNTSGKFKESGVALGIAYDDDQDITKDESYRCYCKNIGPCPDGVPAPTVPSLCTAFGRQDGRGWIPGVSDAPENLGGNNFGISCADIDDDGDTDVLTAETRHWDVGPSDQSELLLNDTPPGQPMAKFRRPGNDKTGLVRPAAQIPWDQGDSSMTAMDFDMDGRKDVYLASSNYPGTHGWIFRQKADGTFENITDRSGGWHASTEGPAFVDYDRDGDLDVVVGTGTFNYAADTNALHVYRNDVGQASNWTRIRFVGAGVGGANPNAIGAHVTLKAGGRTQHYEVKGTNGKVEPGIVVAGLGGACEIEELEIHWPNAELTKTVVKGVRANYALELREGEPSVRYEKK